MFGMGYVFLLAAFLLKLLLGVVALTLACLWAPQRGKRVFIAFVAIAYVASSLNELLLNSYAILAPGLFGGMNYYGVRGSSFHDRMLLLMQLSSWLSFLLYFASGVLLIVYVAMRRTVGDPVFVGGSGDKESVGSVAATPSLIAKQWDTDLPPAKLVSIARRREWGHALDCSPAILSGILLVWTLSLASNQAPNFHGLMDSLTVFVVAIVGPFFLAYLLFKDSFGGISFGKWVTGCRVVDRQTGTPATVPQSLLRNIPFLLFPIGSLIELVVANFRPDRQRLGDQWAGTIVVYGSPQTIDGQRVAAQAVAKETTVAPKKHPLDD